MPDASTSRADQLVALARPAIRKLTASNRPSHEVNPSHAGHSELAEESFRSY